MSNLEKKLSAIAEKWNAFVEVNSSFDHLSTADQFSSMKNILSAGTKILTMANEIKNSDLNPDQIHHVNTKIQSFFSINNSAFEAPFIQFENSCYKILENRLNQYGKLWQNIDHPMYVNDFGLLASRTQNKNDSHKVADAWLICSIMEINPFQAKSTHIKFGDYLKGGTGYWQEELNNPKSDVTPRTTINETIGKSDLMLNLHEVCNLYYHSASNIMNDNGWDEYEDVMSVTYKTSNNIEISKQFGLVTEYTK